MEFTQLNADMNIIRKLADNPTETAAELKAKFDEGGAAVKDYINSVHLPQLTEAIDAAEGEISELLSGLSSVRESLASVRTELSSVQASVKKIPAVINDLSSTSTTAALAANQGRALNTALAGKQKSIAYGTAAPSGGADGDVYIKYV